MSARELREKNVRPVWNKLPENYSAREARYMKRKGRIETINDCETAE